MLWNWTLMIIYIYIYIKIILTTMWSHKSENGWLILKLDNDGNYHNSGFHRTPMQYTASPTIYGGPADQPNVAYQLQEVWSRLILYIGELVTWLRTIASSYMDVLFSTGISRRDAIAIDAAFALVCPITFCRTPIFLKPFRLYI